jgi:hypothetical protein
MSRPARADKPADERDPLAPLSVLVDLTFALIVAFVVFGTVVTILHMFGKAENSGLYSFSSHVCVESDSFMIDTGGEPSVESYARPGSSVQTSGTMFCTQNPSWAMQWAASAGSIFGTGLLLGACLLARRAIKTARQDGIFTAKPARMLRTLGWFLIAMSVIGPIGADIGNGIFIASAAAPALEREWTSEVASIGGPDWAPLVLGICALTFSRVMHRGVSLQEEVALTV